MNNWKFYNISFDDIRQLNSIDLNQILTRDEIALLKVLGISIVDIVKNIKIHENNYLFDLNNKIIQIKNKVFFYLKKNNDSISLIRNNFSKETENFENNLNDFNLMFITLITNISKTIINFNSHNFKLIKEINPLFNLNYFSIFIFSDSFFDKLKINLTDIHQKRKRILWLHIKDNKIKRKIIEVFNKIKLFFENNNNLIFDDFYFSQIIFNNFNEDYIKIIKKILIDSYLLIYIGEHKYLVNSNVNNIFFNIKFHTLDDVFEKNNYYLGILKKVLIKEKKENILKEFNLKYNDLKKLFDFFIDLEFDFLETKFLDFFKNKLISFFLFNKITNLSFLSFQYILKKTNYKHKKSKVVLVDEQEFYNYIYDNKIDNLIVLSREDISIVEYISKNPIKEKEKKIILDRIKGLTLEEIGSKFKITRERVRQIVEKSFKNIGYVKEMEYLDLISKYNISFCVFKELTNLTIESYNFLLIIDKNPSSIKKSEIDFINDFNVSENVKKIVYKNNKVIEINDELIKNKRMTILEKIIRDSNSTVKWNEVEKEFYANYYQKYILEKIDRGFKNRLSDSRNILATINFKYRYYLIDSIDEEIKKQLLNIIYNLEPGFYSTQYIFVNNATLMDEINIYDKYELHNLLKKLFNSEKWITFNRMPNFLFKYNNKIDFYFDLLNKISPIKIKDFVDYMSENYGHDKISFRSNIVNELSEYYSDGFFSLKLKVSELEEEKLILVKNMIDKNDILSIEEITNVFNELDIDLKYLNSFNLKKINYKIFSKYCCRVNITIDMLLNDIINIKNEYNEELFKYTNRYGYDLLYDKLLTYDCILINKTRILTIDLFTKMTNITKSDIFNLLDQIEINMKNYDFFSIENIKNKINSPLLNGVLQNRELTKLITKDKRFIAIYYQDFTLIKFSKNNISLYDFFKKIIVNNEEIKRDHLENYLFDFWMTNNSNFIKYRINDFIYNINNDFDNEDKIYYSNDLKIFYKNKDIYINKILKNK